MDARTTREASASLPSRREGVGTAMPDALDIDFSSANGCDLLRALAQRHGEPLAAAARALTRLFLLRAPWAPGLRFAGGTIGVRCSAGIDGPHSDDDATTLSIGGGGTTVDDALASCIGEAVERASQFRRRGDIAAVAQVRDVSDRLLPSVLERVQGLCSLADHDSDRTFDWIEGRSGLLRDTCLIPADWCLRAPVDGRLALPGAALSTGVAAGRTYEAAALAGLLELIERDAVALWWIGGRRVPAPAMDTPAIGEAHALLRSLRQGRQERVSWVLDLTSDLGVPVMAAVSAHQDGYGFVCGFGARLTASDAVRAAIFEMCQMELGLTIAEARDALRGDTDLSADDRTRLALARSIDTRNCALLHPAGVVASANFGAASEQADDALTALIRHLDGFGIEVALADLTRAEFGIAVVATVAPALQLMPSHVITDRLDATIAANTASPAQYTNGLALF